MRRVLKSLLRSVLVVIVLFAALVAHTIWFKPVKIDWFLRARVRRIRAP